MAPGQAVKLLGAGSLANMLAVAHEPRLGPAEGLGPQIQ